MSIQQVIETLNRMAAEGIIQRYAISGVVGATFYLEPVATLRAAILLRRGMTFDLPTILASKQAYRSRLAAQPIAEKLRLLDALRERTVALRRAGAAAHGRGEPRASLPATPTNRPEPNATARSAQATKGGSNIEQIRLRPRRRVGS